MSRGMEEPTLDSLVVSVGKQMILSGIPIPSFPWMPNSQVPGRRYHVKI